MILPTPGSLLSTGGRPPAGRRLSVVPLERFAAHLFTTAHWTLGSAPASSDDRRRVGPMWRAAIDADVRHASPPTAGPRQGCGRCRRPTPRSSPSRHHRHRRSAAGAGRADAPTAFRCSSSIRRRARCAAAHAGWRGLAAGVPLAAVAGAQEQALGAAARTCLSAIGPSIGACCYEVGADVREAFSAGFSDDDSIAGSQSNRGVRPTNPSMPQSPERSRPDHWFFDGWRSVRDQLEAAGVPAGPDLFGRALHGEPPAASCVPIGATARPTGRMAAAIRSQPHRP